jgi:hypothetical protein
MRNNALIFHSLYSINPLANVMRFWESRPVKPLYLIADFKPGVLNRTGHPVIGASATKRYEMPTWLENTIDRCPSLRTERDVAAVPLLPHEASRGTRISAGLSYFAWCGVLSAKSFDNAGEVVWWVRNAGINGIFGKRRQNLKAVPAMQFDAII